VIRERKSHGTPDSPNHAGGPTDGATSPSLLDFAAFSADVPLVHVENDASGHAGMFHGINDPAAVASGAAHRGQELEVIASVLAIRWLNFTLLGDRGSADYFDGASSTLAGIPSWHVLGQKNLP
jgi:hypothetical protein